MRVKSRLATVNRTLSSNQWASILGIYQRLQRNAVRHYDEITLV